jgi:hypothetical protein
VARTACTNGQVVRCSYSLGHTWPFGSGSTNRQKCTMLCYLDTEDVGAKRVCGKECVARSVLRDRLPFIKHACVAVQSMCLLPCAYLSVSQIQFDPLTEVLEVLGV